MKSNQADFSINPGAVLLFGSGETLPASGKAYEYLAKSTSGKPVISILETPAGFQLNTSSVAQEVGDYLLKRLQNYKPEIHILPARKKNSPHSPDDAQILAPMLASNWIFMGPGSPTYAVKQLSGSLAYDYLQTLHLRGCHICLASAAVLAFSANTLPVYEIYKVGTDLHWAKGLDFFSPFGLDLTLIPHWNNRDGGDGLDTSRCFMGQPRFAPMLEMLPGDTTIVGIDEQTSLLLDLQQPSECKVFGKGVVTIIRHGEQRTIKNGAKFTIDILGPYKAPERLSKAFQAIWMQADQTASENEAPPPEAVLRLAEQREAARSGQDWAAADRLRAQIEAQGWSVMDTPNGPQLTRL